MTLPLAEWSPKIEVGLPRIDAQHRQLFEMAATFAHDHDQVRVMKSVVSLCDYVKVHFREEEEMLEGCGFPGLDAHRRLHEEFKAMLVDFLGRAKQMTLDQIAEEVKHLINGWFYNHIVMVDQEYVPWIKAAARAEAV